MLYVCQLFRPGEAFSFGAGNDQLKLDVLALVALAEDSLAQAAMSLTLYSDAAQPEMRTAAEEQQEHQERKAWIENWLEEQHPDLSWEDRYEREAPARVAYREKRWAEGHWPWVYRHKLHFLYSRTFVSAAYMAYLAIRDMAKLGQSQHAGVAQALDAVVVGLDQAFPGLKDVRDSIEHSNERARGKAQKEEIDPQGLPPFTGAGSLSIGNLWGDDFHWTAADGREAVVSITPESLAALSAGVQAMLDALPWEGDPEPVPSDPGEMP